MHTHQHTHTNSLHTTAPLFVLLFCLLNTRQEHKWRNESHFSSRNNGTRPSPTHQRWFPSFHQHDRLALTPPTPSSLQKIATTLQHPTPYTHTPAENFGFWLTTNSLCFTQRHHSLSSAAARFAGGSEHILQWPSNKVKERGQIQRNSITGSKEVATTTTTTFISTHHLSVQLSQHPLPHTQPITTQANQSATQCINRSLYHAIWFSHPTMPFALQFLSSAIIITNTIC